MVGKIVAVSKDSAEGLLGCIIYYSIGDARIPREAFEEAFKKYKFNEKCMPNELRVPDAFRKATKSAETNWNDFTDKKKYSLMVRDVLNTPETTVRHLVLETRDKTAQSLAYKTDIGKAILHKKAGTMDIEISLGYERFKDKIFKEFNNYSNFYDGNRWRFVIRDILLGCNPVILRPQGSIYFIPKTSMETAENVAKMVADLSIYATSTYDTICMTIPFVDISKNRELLMLRWDLYVKNQALAIVDEMEKEMVKEDYKERSEYYQSKINDLFKNTEQYKTILETQLDESTKILTDLKSIRLQSQCSELASRLKGFLFKES